MAEIGQAIQDIIKEGTVDTLYQIDTSHFIELKAAANIFLQQVQKLSNMDRQALTMGVLKDKITYMYKRMREETSFTREILKYQHQFEVALNDFLQRTIYLTYVNKDGTLALFDDAAIGKLYEQATKNKGRGNISTSTMKRAMNMEAAQDDLQKQIKDAADARKDVYQEAIKRYNKNKKENMKNYNPSERTFYWWKVYHQTLGGWTDPIGSRGPIAEGYAGAVINEDPEVSNNNIETSLAALWYNHIQKDSIGAAVKGDVVMDSNGNIQFAVKSGSFSTGMIGQYVNLAYNIMQLKQLTKAELEEHLPKLVNLTSISQELIESLNNKVEDMLQEVVKSINT